jgi:hypothetical protein
VANPQGQIWHLTTRIYIVTRYNSIYRSLRDAWTAVEISRCGQSECHIAERAGAFVNPDRDSMKGSGSLAPCFLRNEANMYPVFTHLRN